MFVSCVHPVAVLNATFYMHIIMFESWITGVCSTYVVSLYDFAYYVVE